MNDHMNDIRSEDGMALSTRGSHDTNPFERSGAIDNLNDQEKSTLLFEAMGWQMCNTASTNPSKSWRVHDGQDRIVDYVWFPKDYTDDSPPVVDLYSPAHMSLAWRVLGEEGIRHYLPNDWVWAFEDYLIDEFECLENLVGHPGAIEMCLDKILSLAIEAGLIEADKVEVSET